MLKVAVPNKGSLSEGAVKLLTESGFRCQRSGRELVVADHANDMEFLFLRPRDVAIYVGNGIIDLGITGRDLAADSGAEVAELMPLNFGRSRFCFAAPKELNLSSVKELDKKRIACSYPQLLKSKLAELGLDCPVVRLDGAVELSVKLGIADAVADVVESGSTLKEAGLAILGEPLLHSEAVLIGRDAACADLPGARKLMSRIKGVIVASSYVMVEYDIRRESLENACRITPGIEAPTIAPLSNPDWVAVKAMIRKNDVNGIMDELYEIGARGIFITEIRACRM